MNEARYVRKDTRVPPHGCKFCGTAWGQPSATGCCATTRCLACKTLQCMGNGLGRGQCGICLIGLLPGWSGSDRPCGYKGCKERAIAVAPRVKAVCAAHAERAIHGKIIDYQPIGRHGIMGGPRVSITVAAYIKHMLATYGAQQFALAVAPAVHRGGDYYATPLFYRPERSMAGWTEGMTVYVRWNGEFRQATLRRLRDADDGSQDLSVPPDMVRVHFPGSHDGAHNVSWDNVRSELEFFRAAEPLA